MRQTIGSDTTNYLWDELSAYGDVVRETNGTGTELASYALAETQLLAQTRSGVTSYYLSDGQGSTRALLNGTGDLTDTYNYSAFGEIYNQTGSTLNNYRYTGQQFDSLTGLYSLRARYYDPSVGRFLSRDTYPISYRNPIELNRYGYTANNPINGYDPTGQVSMMEYGGADVKTTQDARLLAAMAGGFITGAIGSFITYLGAASGSCGADARDWATYVDPRTFAVTSAVFGAANGAIMTMYPMVEISLAVGAVVGVAATQGPESAIEGIGLSLCSFSWGILTIIEDLYAANDGEWNDDIKVAGGIATSVGATVITNAIQIGVSVGPSGVGIAAASGLATGLVGGFIGIIAGALLSYSSSPDDASSSADDASSSTNNSSSTANNDGNDENDDDDESDDGTPTPTQERYGVDNMPKDPNDLLADGWVETTHPAAQQSPTWKGNRVFVNPRNRMEVRFDPGIPGAPGWQGRDHWHIFNPTWVKGKAYKYLDINGNPVHDGAPGSHLAPR